MNRQAINCTTGETRVIPLTRVEIAERVTSDVAPRPGVRAVTRLQFVRALREGGLKPAFDAALAAASTEVREDWSLAVSIGRDAPLVVGFARRAGLNAAGMDDLFRRAASHRGR